MSHRHAMIDARLPSAQQGVGVLLVFLLILVGATGFFLSQFATLKPEQLKSASQNQADLAAAGEALLIWANHSENLAAPPGMLPYPDRNGDGNYDGYSDCPPAAVSLASNVWRLGRLPYLGERVPTLATDTCEGLDQNVTKSGVGVKSTLKDGNPILYAVSSNVVDDNIASNYPAISSATFSLTTNWLALCNENGAVIEPKVAFVLFAPGDALAGQNRAGVAPGVASYLDSFTLSATGLAPCNNATENNADFNGVFVRANRTTTFNDEVYYVSARRWQTRAVDAAVAAYVARLTAYHRTNGFYPFGATLATTTGDCVNGNVAAGRLPINAAGGCTALSTMPVWGDSPGQAWYDNTVYQRISANQARLSFTACSTLFTLNWDATTNRTSLQRSNASC